jgi:signal transduction histidine kinase
MPRSLTGRIVLAIAVTTVAVWVAMGLSLIVILSTLHANATKSSLADIGQTLVVRFRTAALDGEVRTIVTEVREAVAGSGIAVDVLRPNGTYADLGDAAGPASPAAAVPIPDSATRGQTVTGAIPFDDGATHLYAATVLRAAGTQGPRAILLSLPDQSRSEALADLARTLPIVVLLGLAVGIPLAWLSARSVAGPLRRLAAATADLPTNGTLEPLPIEGPTEVRELTVRFNAMADELATSARREAELLADLRHDLRTPLTVIGGYAAAIADGTAEADEAIRASRTIGDEAARLERLIDELGAVERLRRGTDALRPESLDAREVVAATADRFASAAASAGIDLSVVALGANDDDLTFAADRGAVERIMANLVSNALAIAPSPGGHVWLAATAGPSTATSGATIILAVTDDGPGFPPGASEHVFERFYRADPARSGPGSGLGLAIVRELANVHGGTARAENVAPHGARVSVVLPRLPVAT